jgi:hypothetical protein
MEDNLRKTLQDKKDKRDAANRELSKKRLITNISKKFNTSMIGALASIEEEFGELWGHGKKELSRDEIYWRTKWESLRAAILDRGNSQLRAAINEVSEYSLSWERYSLTFLPATLLKEKE